MTSDVDLYRQGLYRQGRQSIAEAQEKANRLVSLLEGWVNAEEAQRDRADRAEARVAALEAALRTALGCWSHRVEADAGLDNYVAAEKELVAECRDVLVGGRAHATKEGL